MYFLSTIFSAAAHIIHTVIWLYTWIIIISAVLSWVNPDPYNPIVRALRTMTEPVFYRVRKWLPFTYSSGMDFSPVVVLLSIELFNRIVVASLAQYALAIQ